MISVSEVPDFAEDAWLEMYRDIDIINNPLWRLYVGSIDGTPVSTSALFLAAGVAGIHGVPTFPEYRGRRIGTAMIYPPLVYSPDQGYRVGALFSSEMVVCIYRDIGLVGYGEGNIYIWQPPEDSP